MCIKSINLKCCTIGQWFGKVLVISSTVMEQNKVKKDMTTIDVKKLTSCGSDWESNQYTLLSRIKEWSLQLHKNKLFPALEESFQLNESLEEILKENLECKWWFDSEIRARKLNERITVYEKAQQIGIQLDKLIEFVVWAIKLNKKVTDEGIIIKEFVEDNLFIRQLSDEKNYLGKGYFSIPDNKKQILNIYLYEINWNWSQSDLLHYLQTKLVRSIPFEMIDHPIEKVMEDFVNYSQKLYDPVVYVLETDLDFPFNETIYPVAEEILLSTIRV